LVVRSATAPALVVTAHAAGPKSVRRIQDQDMNTKSETKLLHACGLVADVLVERIDTECGWSPYLSVEDAQKIASVKEASRLGDLKSAARPGRIFRLTPAK